MFGFKHPHFFKKLFTFLSYDYEENTGMKQLGIDLGTSTVKIVLMESGGIEEQWIAAHHGKTVQTLLSGLRQIPLPRRFCACITGNNRSAVVSLCPQLVQAEDIPALVEGVRSQAGGAGSIIDIGSQGARFVTDLFGGAPRFAVNEHCAGGTGSFFEDQMSRLGLPLEDYSRIAEQAREIPNISGRCAVFAKTDVIHRQQEGVPKQDILLGLCYAMIRNYKATIVKNLPVRRPVVFTGGVTCNSGVIRAIRDIFELSEQELIVPEQARYVGAVGAALEAGKACSSNRHGDCPEIEREEFFALLEGRTDECDKAGVLPKLSLLYGTDLSEPACSEVLPPEGCYLGIDIGSTSTDLVMTAEDGTLVDFQYLRTAGDPEAAVRRGLDAIRSKYGELSFRGVGVTGSGRERIGRMTGADAVRDEITAQARAASFWAPEADTVFEIGGQDSKYISLKNGEVADFQMNKICAAGTGSFIEEQAARMGISIEDFGPAALSGSHPCDLGERCTVFIETAVAQAASQGAEQADIAAGLCHSVVKNYLHKVVGNKRVGNSVVLQGGVAYNPAVVAAFQSVYGERIRVSPVFSVSGAFGAALLAKEAVGNGKSGFLGFDFPKEERKSISGSDEIRKNRAFYRKAGQIIVEDYDGRVDPRKKTIGVPLTLIMFKFFPMVNAFFRNLGFNVVLSHASNEETIRLSQRYAQGETCYPVKLIYGHMMQLAEQKVDYIFLPSIHTIRHPHAGAEHNYACPYMQTAARVVFENLGLEKRGIRLLSPVLDLELGAKMMGMAMLDTGAALGFARPRCVPGLLRGAVAVNRYTENVEKMGRELMAQLKPEDKVLVLITRNYGLSDPVLNMGIPEILLSRGYKVMTLGHLPGMSLDLSADYPGMYWPFGDHLLSGAKLIAHHPNLYAVYLTNHGCGPDTLISHMFREEMGEKPYLQIEVDEHYSRVGVITRIEAFLNSISHRPPAKLPDNFDILNVKMKPAKIQRSLKECRAEISGTEERGLPEQFCRRKLAVPPLGGYSRYLIDYCRACGVDTEEMPAFSREILAVGRAEMNSKEYLPLPMLTGSALQMIRERGADRDLTFLIPGGYGADADGQYFRAVRTILDRCGCTECEIAAPVLEELSEKAEDPLLLFRALLTGDLFYTLPAKQRQKYAPQGILSMEQMLVSAKQAKDRNVSETGKNPAPLPLGRYLAATGSPMCLTSLNEGILEKLENEGYLIRRMPLSEMMWFLWKDNKKGDPLIMEEMFQMMSRLSSALGEISPFSSDVEELFSLAEERLGHFSANNGRYRYAKAVQMGQRAAAVLTFSPRYENTAMVLELCGLSSRCGAPLFEVSLDGDWDESSWARLRSFLYYCR